MVKGQVETVVGWLEEGTNQEWREAKDLEKNFQERGDELFDRVEEIRRDIMDADIRPVDRKILLDKTADLEDFINENYRFEEGF